MASSGPGTASPRQDEHRSLLEAQLDVTSVFALLMSLAIQYRELTDAAPVLSPVLLSLLPIAA